MRLWLSRNRLRILALLICGTGVSVLLLEISLRLLGRPPLGQFGRPANEPLLWEVEPVTGMHRKRVGRFRFPGYSPGAADIVRTIWPDGTRATAPEPREGLKSVLFVGCSMTEGAGVSDDETFPWKVQTQFPDLAVKNRGVAGFSTLHTLLDLRRALTQSRVDLVVYGFIPDHERRNVASADWQHVLRVASPLERIWLRGDFDPRGSLIVQPERIVAWPGARTLATVNAVQQLWDQAMAASRTSRAAETTRQLILLMREELRVQGADLLVVALAPFPSPAYAEFFGEHRISAIECPINNGGNRKEFVVKGEGHPNGRAHSQYAACISAELSRRPLGQHRAMLGPGPS
jgi:hypothetical protein